MSTAQKLFFAVGALAIVGVGLGVARFARPGSGPAGENCRGVFKDARRACYAKLFSDRLARGGVADAMATLETLARADRDVAERSHEYAHGIGIESFKLYPDIVATFVACGDGSASGCRHGFMQASLESQHHISGADLQSFCRPLEDPKFNRALLFQCIHGMGHGLTMFRRHDGPAALRDCDLLATDWDRTSCYGGVFMETFVNATSPHHPATELSAQSHQHASTFKAIDPADPLYPCSIMEHKYLYACYQIQTSVILHLNGGNIGATARVCDRAPVDMRTSCYESLGRDVTAYAARNPGRTAELCAKGSTPYRPACYSGAAKSLVNWTATTEGGFELCRIVAQQKGATPLDATSCYAGLGGAISTLFARPDEREEQCTRAQDLDAIAACRQGAGLR